MRAECTTTPVASTGRPVGCAASAPRGCCRSLGHSQPLRAAAGGAAMTEQRATVTCPPRCLPLTAPIGARRGRAARVAEATGLGRPCAAAALAVGLRAGR